MREFKERPTPATFRRGSRMIRWFLLAPMLAMGLFLSMVVGLWPFLAASGTLAISGALDYRLRSKLRLSESGGAGRGGVEEENDVAG